MLRVAVVGSGPAGFYAADGLLASQDPAIEVDMLERLPTPWGLVRLGVAPDHPKIKAVSRAFERIAARPGFRFFGNVEVGRDVTHEELAQLYDAVVYSVGAQTDRRLGIPGEDLPGSWPATVFVAWYNGHPDFQDLPFDLSGERAVVIGNGNVAVDVARMLALTEEELAPTDTTDAAIEAIVGSGLGEILMLGRRGPAQAAFTTPELKELGELAGADVIVDRNELALDAASAASLEHDTNARRNLEVLHEYAERSPAGKPRRLVLRFCVSPVEILGDGRVEAIEIVRNELVADASGALRAVPTEDRKLIQCSLVFRSVGYRAVPVPGVPFDDKRAPTGVIGTNKKDAAETVELLLEDARAGLLARAPGAATDDLETLLQERGVRHVAYAGWEAIDAAERTRGEALGRPRVKLCSWNDLLAAARAAAAQKS